MKFTAGLHHPLRHFSKTRDSMAHGFLNILVRCLYQYSDIKQDKIDEILRSEDSTKFEVTDKELSFHFQDQTSIHYNRDDIQTMRQQLFHSFGSCSVDIPLTDLKEKGWLK